MTYLSPRRAWQFFSSGTRSASILTACLALLLLQVTLRAAAAEGSEPAAPPLWDTRSDTWVATDALGRQLPGLQEACPARPDRFVGAFYFLWLGAHTNGGPFDITRILAQDPDVMQKKDSPLWGPMHAPHHWGESIFGYYLSDDPYVLRKHAQMLADAGVDVIIFDVTNQVTYRQYYMALLKAFSEVRRNGGKTPQVAFLTPFWDPPRVVAELFKDLYEPGIHPELWFRWEGKPLILADPAKVGDGESAARIKAFFTFRKPQPDYFKGPEGPDMWSWLEVYPQHVFKNSRGEKEQMSVGVGQNAVGNRLATMSEAGAKGRSFHGGGEDHTPGAVLRGLNFAEQWKRALAEDPRFIFITGWNEWYAGRFDEFAGVRQPVMFVDEFDQEHSRDVEPMKGGHGDNYYYQMVSEIRRYKGLRPPPAASLPQTIRLKGGFEQWARVAPEYRDDIGDTQHRDHFGYNNFTRYVNRSGRNDLVLMQVARDKKNLYFHVRTREPITPPGGTNWMVLFLDVDRDHRTGWEGYDFMVSHAGRTNASGMVCRNTGGWKWTPVVEVSGVMAGNDMHLAIPRVALGLEPAKGPLRFDFKWADNVPDSGNILDFIDNGDVAPNGRFNYRFSE